MTGYGSQPTPPVAALVEERQPTSFKVQLPSSAKANQAMQVPVPRGFPQAGQIVQVLRWICIQYRTWSFSVLLKLVFQKKVGCIRHSASILSSFTNQMMTSKLHAWRIFMKMCISHLRIIWHCDSGLFFSRTWKTSAKSSELHLWHLSSYQAHICWTQLNLQQSMNGPVVWLWWLGSDLSHKHAKSVLQNQQKIKDKKHSSDSHAVPGSSWRKTWRLCNGSATIGQCSATSAVLSTSKYAAHKNGVHATLIWLHACALRP